MSWVLVLTFIYHLRGGVSVEHIPGFKTQEECRIAADVWASAVRSESDWLRARTVCVSQSK
jgi:hypothetical protein